MERKIQARDNKVLKHVGKGFWNLGLVVTGIAFIFTIVALTYTEIHTSANDYHKNMGTISAILSIVAFVSIFIGLCFKLPSLVHGPSSKVLFKLATFFYSIAYMIFNFAVGGMNNIVKEGNGKGAAFGAIAMTSIAVFLAVMGLIIWCIYRFRHTTFAKVHDFDESKK